MRFSNNPNKAEAILILENGFLHFWFFNLAALQIDDRTIWKQFFGTSSTILGL